MTRANFYVTQVEASTYEPRAKASRADVLNSRAEPIPSIGGASRGELEPDFVTRADL